MGPAGFHSTVTAAVERGTALTGMKVLHIIDSAGFYGAERVVIELMREQVDQRLQPVLCSIGHANAPEKAIEREAKRHGLEVRPLRFRDGPNPMGSAKLVRLGRHGRFDLVHSHGYKSNILLGMLPRGIRRLPMVSTVHGWTNTGELNRMMLYEWLDARALSRVDRVVVVSPSMLNDSRLRPGPAPVVCVPNGIRLQPANGQGPQGEWAGFKPGGLRLGCVGRLSREKGHDLLIRAVSQLVSAGADCRLFILGDGKRRRALEKLVGDAGLEERIFLAGYRERAYRYLRYCDIWVLPSLREGLPITLLEAMQQSCPIVATRVGAVPEVLEQGKAGMLVEPGDSEALAGAIETLHADPDRARRLGATARAIARRDYSVQAMERAYREIYGQLVAQETDP